MPAPSGKGNVAGYFVCQLYKRYQGNAYGTIADPATATGPTTSHAYLLRDPIRAQIPAIQRAIAEFRGGRGILGQMMLGVESLGNIPVEFANLDATAQALCNESNVDTTTVANWRIGGPNHSNPDLARLGMILAAKFQDREAGSDGDDYYINFFLPNVQIDLNLPALTREGGVNPGIITGTVIPSFSGKFPNGQAFGTNQGFNDNVTDVFWIITEKPLALTTFIADGVATSFTLGYKPVKNTVTGGNTDNWFTKDSVNTAPSSVNTGTGAVTISAGSDGDLWHAVYQTDFIAA